MLSVSGKSMHWLLIAVLMTMQGGCSLHRAQPSACCPPYISQRGDFQESKKPGAALVESEFASVGDYESVRRSSANLLGAGDPAVVDLREILCAAARNSELADVIEAERHAILCRVDDCEPHALDLLLMGEALEQRNKAAGAAGGLFLRLVEVALQREVLQASQAHLDQLAATLQGAETEGFSTANGEFDLAAGRNHLQLMETKLNTSEQRLTCELNGLINRKQLNLIQPVYKLEPVYMNLDLETEVRLAETGRPGIAALETALAIGAKPEAVLELLGIVESRPGFHSPPQSIGDRILAHKLKQRLNSGVDAGSSASRRDQLARLLEGRKRQAGAAARAAVIKIQGSFEKLAIANERIAALNTQAEQLLAKQKVDSEGAYLKINQNWLDLQTAKSERITAAIEHDMAVIELQQAQGEMAHQCGYRLNHGTGNFECNTPTP